MKIFIYEPDDLVRYVHERIKKLSAHRKYLYHLLKFFQKFETNNPDEADFFFIPINLIFFQFCNVYKLRKNQHYPDPYDYIKNLPYLSKKKHLILATGDYGQRSRSPYELNYRKRPYPELYEWLDDRFILLAFESTSYLWSQDIALLPYVLNSNGLYHKFLLKLMGKSAIDNRDLLYSFSGAMKYRQLPSTHIRGGRLFEIAGAETDHFINDSSKAKKMYGPIRGSDVGMLKRSVFTLCPAGFGRWTFRFAQALTYGSIPVLIADGYIKPFSKFIEWDNFVVTIPESDLGSIDSILRNMSKDKIRYFQKNIRDNWHLFQETSVHELIIQELETKK